MGARTSNHDLWHYVPVVLGGDQPFDLRAAVQNVSRLRQGDRVIIGLASTPADASVVRDRAGNLLGLLSRAARVQAESATAAVLPATAQFERTLEFGFMIKIPKLSKPQQSVSLVSPGSDSTRRAGEGVSGDRNVERTDQPAHPSRKGSTALLAVVPLR